MTRTSFLIAAVVALVASVVITLRADPRPIEERLVDIQVAELMPEMADALSTETVALKRLFIEYSDNPLLVLKARAALLRYPDLARRVFALYGSDAAFQSTLSLYGEQVLLPIAYFLDNEVHTVSLMHEARNRYRAALNDAVPEELTPVLRGWYAIHFIVEEGHVFLGQFVVDASGTPRWVQSERWVQGAASLLTSGVRNLEARWRSDEAVGAADVGWAAVDVIVVVGVLKLARLGKAAAGPARAGAGIAATTRAAAMRTVPTLGRLAVVGTVAYVVIAHPSLVNSFLSSVAEWTGLPQWFALGAGWALILFPVVWLLLLVFRVLVKPTILVLQWVSRTGSTRPSTRPGPA